MSSKPEKWLQALANDADHHRTLSLVERFSRALRYFRTGRSKTAQKALRDFVAWQEKQNQAPAIGAAIDASEASFKPHELLSSSEDLADVRLIVADFRGGEALQRTLGGLPFDSFHSHVVVSPYDDKFSGSRYFDIFAALDHAIREDTDAGSLLIVESGAVLTESPAPLGENIDVSFLRWQSHDGALQPVPLDAQSLLREPLAPMVFPALLVRPGTPLNFSHCWHYAGWDLLLHFMDDAPDRMSFPEDLTVSFVHHDYQLNKLDRKHLAMRDKEKLQRLPDATGEWSVTRHDLIGRIVQRHPDYFKDNAAYLAAIAAATRGC